MAQGQMDLSVGRYVNTFWICKGRQVVEDFYSDAIQFQRLQDRSHHLGACHCTIDICIFLNIWMTAFFFPPLLPKHLGSISENRGQNNDFREAVRLNVYK